jgi:hypothetical protein
MAIGATTKDHKKGIEMEIKKMEITRELVGALMKEISIADARISLLVESKDLWKYALIDGEHAKINSLVGWMAERGVIDAYNRGMTPDEIRQRIREDLRA